MRDKKSNSVASAAANASVQPQAQLLDFEIVTDGSVLDAVETVPSPIFTGMTEVQNNVIRTLETAVTAFKVATTGLRDAIRAAQDANIPESIIIHTIKFAAGRAGVGKQTISAALIACGVRQRPARVKPPTPEIIPGAATPGGVVSVGLGITTTKVEPASATPPAVEPVKPVEPASGPVKTEASATPPTVEPAKVDVKAVEPSAPVPAATPLPVPATEPVKPAVEPAKPAEPAKGKVTKVETTEPVTEPTVKAEEVKDPVVDALVAWFASNGTVTGSQIGKAILRAYGSARAQAVMADAFMVVK